MPEPTQQINQNQPLPAEAPPQTGITWTALKPEKTVTEQDIALAKLVELGDNYALMTAAFVALAGKLDIPEIDPTVRRIQGDQDAVLEFRVRLVGRNGVLGDAVGSADIPQLLLPSALQKAKQRVADLIKDMVLEPVSTKFADAIAPAQAEYAAQNNAAAAK